MKALTLTLTAACLVLLAAPALADTVIAAPPSTTTVFIGNALTVILAACVPPVAAIAAGALWKAWTWFGFQATAQDKANLESDLKTALAFGVSKALPEIAAKGWDNIDVHSQIVADAANFTLDRFPDRATALTAAANSNQVIIGAISPIAAVQESLNARLPDAIAIAAASPATPPAPDMPPQIIVMAAQPAPLVP